MATEVRSLLDEGTQRLARVVDEPRREAEILLGAALRRTRAWLLAHDDERILDCDATDHYEALVTRRALGEPVAYLLGEKEFWSLPLAVVPGVLIPRPETELLVERAVSHLPVDAARDVLDLACGSGAVALEIASERPGCRVVATDVSAAAIATTIRNAGCLGLGERIEVREGAWFTPVAGRHFDAIASNPPYIADDDPRVEAAVRRWEPAGALFAGPTGLEALGLIVAQAPLHLRPCGWLLLEHGDAQGAAVRDLLVRAGFDSVRTYRDLAGHERCTEGRLAATARFTASLSADASIAATLRGTTRQETP
jgi:release factor glutamine methyltransferase